MAVVLQPSGVVYYLPFVNWSHRDYDRIGRNASTPEISHTNLGRDRVRVANFYWLKLVKTGKAVLPVYQ